MTISTQLVTANAHFYLPVEVWRERIATLLAFSEIVSVFFQTCHFLRASRYDILRPIAAAELELMQIPSEGLNVPLERIVSVWLRLSSAALRAMRDSLAEHPPIIYAAQFADVSVLLNERLISLHGENGLLTPPPTPSGADFFSTTTDLATDHVLNAEKSIRRACLIARTYLNPDRAAKRFVKIAFKGHLLWGHSRLINMPTPSEWHTWERAQVVLNFVPDALRDLVCFYLARASYSSGGTMAIEYAYLISDRKLREKMLSEIAKKARILSENSPISESYAKSHWTTITTSKKRERQTDDPFKKDRALSESRYRNSEARSESTRSEKSIEKIKPREQNILDQRTENCAEKTLIRKPPRPASDDDDDSRVSKMAKSY